MESIYGNRKDNYILIRSIADYKVSRIYIKPYNPYCVILEMLTIIRYLTVLWPINECYKLQFVARTYRKGLFYPQIKDIAVLAFG